MIYCVYRSWPTRHQWGTVLKYSMYLQAGKDGNVAEAIGRILAEDGLSGFWRGLRAQVRTAKYYCSTLAPLFELWLLVDSGICMIFYTLQHVSCFFSVSCPPPRPLVLGCVAFLHLLRYAGRFLVCTDGA